AYEVAADLRKGAARREALRDAARIELGLRAFLESGPFVGYTDTFENLHGVKQLPGIASQRLMADGYGFGAEGDWKAAAMVRAAKVMALGLDGGTSFMEDYTYHLQSDDMQCLGAHMLEICPSIAAGKPSCEIHPLGIGGKEDPVRLVFDAPTGPAVNATLVDLGRRFRMVLNKVDVIAPAQKLEKLPVARALWRPLPDLATAAAAWIQAGGSHHPVFSQA
ncbi:MAG: L-arabinose isomerase, partial [Verrucomicrobiae bacterium]|nr:L-arabinose isomerase [Verrucomicrobiae bacterium]